MALAHGGFKLTYQDYVLLSEQKRGELIDGDFFVSPSPSSKHQQISGKIQFLLTQWVKARNLGEVFDAPMDVKFSEYDTTQPDILFIAKNRLGIIEENYIAGPPDFIVEILSPSNKQLDLVAKVHLYSKSGVKEYWIVDPMSETITVYDYVTNQLELRQIFPKPSLIPSRTIEGFRLNSSDIF